MNEEPLVRVLRGEPAPDELAALVAVLLTRSSSPPRAAASAWAASGRPWAGHRSWRASTLPRR
ncbi:MAG TPA: acyl-CoA carboxylase subunit epsilon [Actinoplanes sp.]|nr:acyl-CoA carboxylase subunit epsilon [Actinoplanes sp.]